VITGAIYLAAMVPLLRAELSKQDANALEVVLFANMPQNAKGAELYRWMTSNRHNLYAFGLLYGATALVAALLVKNMKNKDLVVLVVSSNALLIGTWATFAAARWMGRYRGEIIVPNYLTLAYVFLVYYLHEGILVRLDSMGAPAKKYGVLSGGFYGIAVSWLLTKTFNGSIAQLLSGPIFLVSVFVITLIGEWTVWPMLVWGMERAFKAEPPDVGARMSLSDLLVPVALFVLFPPIGLWVTGLVMSRMTP